MKSLLILTVAFFSAATSFAYPQSISKRATSDSEGRPTLALMAAKAEHIYRLENLLALLENDRQTNEEYLEKNKSLISKRGLEPIEGLIENSKELINFTRKMLARAELLWLMEDDNNRAINRHTEPYNETELLRIIRLNALPESEIIQAIEERGVDFEADEIDQMLLLNAGASKELVGLISLSYRH